MPAPPITLICNHCKLAFFNSFSLLRHLTNHKDSVFCCGLNLCSFSFSNISLLATHLKLVHPEFFHQSHLFSANLLETSFVKFSTTIEPSDSNNSPLDINPLPEIDLSDFQESEGLLDDKTKIFLKILVDHGCKFNIPFNSLKNLGISLSDFFLDLKNKEQLDESLVHNLKHSINSSDRFDENLEKYFNANFGEVINIANSNENFVIFSLKKTLNLLFSKFESFDNIYNPPNSDENITSFFSTLSHKHVDTFYVNIYLDDFQLANPLLRKKSLNNSLTAIYIRILTTDNFNLSKKDNIHILSLIKSNVFKSFSNAIMQYISREFNLILNNPFLVTIKDSSKLMNMKVGFISADSMASSYILGLKNGFTHGFCCRFCKCHKNEFSSLFFEDISILKNQSFYEQSIVHLNDSDSNQDYFGQVKESCMKYFNISNFFEIFPPCVDHDIFEGIFLKILKFSIEYFVKKKFMTYNSFQDSISNFKFTGKDKEYFPLLKLDSCNRLRLTAVESFTLSRFILIFFENIPKTDNVYILVELLIKIIKLLMSFHFSPEKIAILQNIIASFIEKSSEFSQDLSMTIKFHHLIHYPRMIQLFGPPRIFSTINFESLHSLLKSSMKTSNNWKNVCLTIANKYARFRLATTKEKSIKEIGCRINAFPLPEIMNFQNDEIISFTLDGLIFDSRSIYALRHAIELEVSDITLNFCLICKIFRINESYFFSGKVFECFQETNGKVYLFKEISEIYIDLYGLKNKFIHEIYNDNFGKFIVPYTSIDF